MWVRRSEEEITIWRQLEEQKKKEISRPFFLSLVVAIAGFIAYLVGFRGSLRGMLLFTNTSSAIGVRAVMMFVFLFVIIFSIALYNQRRFGKLTSVQDSLLCQTCLNPSAYNMEYRCNCGGRLEPYGYFDWVDNEATIST